MTDELAGTTTNGSTTGSSSLGRTARLSSSSSTAPSPATIPELSCLAVSPDGRHVAVGDHKGQLRVFDMNTLSLTLVMESHDGEVLAVDYSPLIIPGGGYLLASGGRDGTVHVYDARKDYDIVRTMTDHTEDVTAVRFAAGGKVLVSCSTDKRVMFRCVRD